MPEPSGSPSPALPGPTHQGEVPASSRDKILDTAEPLFARAGFSGVGLREVAERVGLGKSSLFHHFPSKVQLYAAVLQRVLQEFDSRLEALSSDDESPIAQLHVWIDAVVDALVEHPTWAALLLRTLVERVDLDESTQQGIDAQFARITGRVCTTLEAGIRRGEIRPVSVPHTIQTLIGMTVFHFASGEMGEDVLGASVFSTEQIRLRRVHLRDYLSHALAFRPRSDRDGTD